MDSLINDFSLLHLLPKSTLTPLFLQGDMSAEVYTWYLRPLCSRQFLISCSFWMTFACPVSWYTQTTFGFAWIIWFSVNNRCSCVSRAAYYFINQVWDIVADQSGETALAQLHACRAFKSNPPPSDLQFGVTQYLFEWYRPSSDLAFNMFLAALRGVRYVEQSLWEWSTEPWATAPCTHPAKAVISRSLSFFIYPSSSSCCLHVISMCTSMWCIWWHAISPNREAVSIGRILQVIQNYPVVMEHICRDFINRTRWHNLFISPVNIALTFSLMRYLLLVLRMQHLTQISGYGFYYRYSIPVWFNAVSHGIQSLCDTLSRPGQDISDIDIGAENAELVKIIHQVTANDMDAQVKCNLTECMC